MRTLAIIPAREGSKRLPGKNIRALCGRPLLAHSVMTARAVRQIDAVVVSSDSMAYGEIATQFGARFVLRPRALAEDATRTEPVLTHALAVVEQEDSAYDVVVLLQPTSPLRSVEDVERAMTTFLSSAYDTVISTTPFHGYRYVQDGDGLIPQFEQRGRSQDRQAEYVENGAVYVAHAALIRAGGLIGARIGHTTMPAWRSIDVDTEDDFLLAEQLLLHVASTRV